MKLYGVSLVPALAATDERGPEESVATTAKGF